MGLKTISIALFGLALCCFLQGTAAAQGECQLTFWPDKAMSGESGSIEGEGSRYSPFTTWYISSNGAENLTRTLDSLEVVRQVGCESCVLTIFESSDLTGKSYSYDFRINRGYEPELPITAKSFNLKCFPEGDPVFQEMNEGDGSTLPHQLVELRHNAFQQAIARLVSKAALPAGQYTSERVFATEFANNYDGVYRFNVQARDASGVEYRIWFITLSDNDDKAIVLDAGYKENRVSEFTHTEFKTIPAPSQQNHENYPVEVSELGTKSVNQAVGRMLAKDILPPGNYSLFVYFYDFNPVEYSAIVNMTEYPNPDDMLYRFGARVIDQSEILFSVWTLVATNYETPEYYELIDYGYKQTRLADFGDTEWRPMNEDEDMPLPGDIVEMRSRSVAQAIPRLLAEGALPDGQYTIANTYTTEFAWISETPAYSYLTLQRDDTLYRFNVQLSNEAGARFRVVVVVAAASDLKPKYELIDYFYIENRLDEFTNTNFHSLNEGDIQTTSINQAVEKLQSKSVLPQDKYTLAKTFPTEFSANFEHPDYSTDDYILYKFTAQVNNAAGTGFKVYAIVITAYDAPEDFEMIDYGKLDA